MPKAAMTYGERSNQLIAGGRADSWLNTWQPPRAHGPGVETYTQTRLDRAETAGRADGQVLGRRVRS